MKLAAHVLAYNVSRFINPMLENLSPHVDRIYLAYPSRPFGYIKESRETKTNPTSLSDINIEKYGDKIKVVEGDWMTEEDTRNECLKNACEEGFDWLLIQDADEFYAEAQWHQLMVALEKYRDRDVLHTTWYNFWKSSQYVLVDKNGRSIKSVNAGFAVRCRPGLNFIQQRKANSNSFKIIDAPCFHYGYVQDDQEIFEKVMTWSHAGQFDPRKWFNLKWKGWDLNTKYLHPIYPVSWNCAVPFPNVQPDFAEQFNLDFGKTDPKESFLMKEMFYDAKASALARLRRIKNIVC